MNQTQILLLLLATIPFLDCFAMSGFFALGKKSDLVSRVTPILFLLTLFCLNHSVSNDSSLVLLALTADISLVLGVDATSLHYLFLLNFFWIIFSFYSWKFLQLKKVSGVNSFRTFTALAISFSSLIIISDNVLTVLFFCYFLMMIRYFFASKFFFKKADKSSYLSLSFIFLEPILLFLAAFLTYHISGKLDFSNVIISSNHANLIHYQIIWGIYFLGLFLSFLAPFYLFIRNINCDPIITYSFFFLSTGLSSFYIFTKLLGTVFQFDALSLIILRDYFIYFEYFFLVIILAISLVLILSRGIKSSFLYLLFHQVIIALFAMVTFFIFKPHLIQTSLFSLYLSLTLMFLCLSNLVIYLSLSERKDFKGLCYHLKMTISCLIFGVLSLIGLVPAISIVGKFHLIKIIMEEGLLISGLVLIINTLTIVIFAWKLRPLFLKSDQEERSEVDIELAKKIDSDYSLIITILATTLAMILLIIPFFNTFL